MIKPDLLALFRECPIIASVQSAEGSPLQDTDTLVRLARLSVLEGVKVVRAEGKETIKAIREQVGVPVIGRIRREYPDSEVRSTATLQEVEELIDTGCEVIALDATSRPRPNGVKLFDLVARIRQAGRLVLADCDVIESVEYAIHEGADFVSTALSGYTSRAVDRNGPDMSLLKSMCSRFDATVMAEGRYSQPWQVETALRAGASGVVIGGAINDPTKQTRSFVSSLNRHYGRVGAVDIGRIAMRWGVFDEDWTLLSTDRILLPDSHKERVALVRQKAQDVGVTRIGIGTIGTVNPRQGHIWECSDDDRSVREVFNEDVVGVPCVVLNGGLAAAWGHACHSEYVGQRIATITLSSTLGFGFVSNHRLTMGPLGQYPRLNDLIGMHEPNLCGILEEAALNPQPSRSIRDAVQKILNESIESVRAILLPDTIVVCGPVGLSDWLDINVPFRMGWQQVQVFRSPFGMHAGLHGASALALFPPDQIQL